MTSEITIPPAIAGSALPRKWLPLALTAWGVLVLAQVVTPFWYPTPDSCGYLSIARSLATTAHPTNLGNPHLTYAVGYPFLISPVFLLHISPFLAVTMLHALLAVLYVVGVYIWAKRYAPEAALPIALMAVGNAVVLAILRRVLSESVFMPALIWLVILMSTIGPGTRSRWRLLLGAALLLTLMALVRQTGIFFIAGFALQLAITAWHRRITWVQACRWSALVGVPALAALITMISLDHHKAIQSATWSNLDVFTHAASRPPTDFPDQSFAAQVVEGLRVRVSEVGRLLIPGMFNAYGTTGQWLNINMLVYLPLAAVVLIGWMKLLRRGVDAFALTAPFYIGLYIYWPFNQSGRYLAPFVPLFLVCCWLVLELLGQRRLSLARGLVVAHLAVALGYWACIDQPRMRQDHARWADLQRIADFLRPAPEGIEIASGLGCSTQILEYQLDCPVREQGRRQPIANDTQWLVTAADAPGPEGFTREFRIGQLQLLRRAPSAVAQREPIP